MFVSFAKLCSRILSRLTLKTKKKHLSEFVISAPERRLKDQNELGDNYPILKPSGYKSYKYDGEKFVLIKEGKFE